MLFCCVIVELCVLYSDVCCSIYSTATMSTPSSKVDKVFDNITKSPEDSRLYRGLELKNRLKVLLISDPVTDKSAASLDVHIGTADGASMQAQFI